MADTTAPQQVSPAIHTDTSSAPTSGGKTTTTITTPTTTTTYLQPQPIAIPSTPGSSSANHHNLTDPNSNNCNNSAQDIISPISPSKSIARKTGTRSTFCPNTLRKCTKLTDEDFDHHENDSAQNYQGQSTGWLGMLGLKKNANYGDELSKYNECHEQAYY